MIVKVDRGAEFIRLVIFIRADTSQCLQLPSYIANENEWFLATSEMMTFLSVFWQNIFRFGVGIFPLFIHKSPYHSLLFNNCFQIKIGIFRNSSLLVISSLGPERIHRNTSSNHGEYAACVPFPLLPKNLARFCALPPFLKPPTSWTGVDPVRIGRKERNLQDLRRRRYSAYIIVLLWLSHTYRG